MSYDVDVWKGITTSLATLLSDCDVTRTYDVLAKLDELDDKTKPQVWVCLDGKETMSETNISVRDSFHFVVFIAKYISGKTDAEKEAEMDGLIPYIQTIQNHLYLHEISVQTSGTPSQNVQLFLISGDPDSGEMFDIDFFNDSETFLCSIGANVLTIREVTHGS